MHLHTYFTPTLTSLQLYTYIHMAKIAIVLMAVCFLRLRRLIRLARPGYAIVAGLTGLDCTGLDWLCWLAGLDWTGLDWTGLAWPGLDWRGRRP